MKTDNKLLFENKSKFLLVHASSGFKHALKEVLADPAVQARLADTKASEEVAWSKNKNVQFTFRCVHWTSSIRC